MLFIQENLLKYDKSNSVALYLQYKMQCRSLRSLLGGPRKTILTIDRQFYYCPAEQTLTITIITMIIKTRYLALYLLYSSDP